MKRITTSLLLSTSVPLAVFFAIAARPARLYAETGVPFSCTELEFQACDGKTTGDGCSTASGVGRCQPNQCTGDAGLVNGLRCQIVTPCVSQSQVDECAGKAPGALCGPNGLGSCGTTTCAVYDAGAYDGSILACFAPAPADDGGASSDGGAGGDAGVPDNQGGGCAAAGVSSGSGFGAGAGLLLAMAALARVLRRSRRHIPAGSDGGLDRQ